ncbi:DivIVA domain-containing protein [Streptomyces sp. 900105245]
MLTHKDIMEKKFSVTRIKEGYAQDEVDDFLEILASHCKLMEERVARMGGERNAAVVSLEVTNSLHSEGESIQPTSRPEAPERNNSVPANGLDIDAIKTVLASAQEAANQITGKALLEAERLRSDAVNQSSSLLDEAKNKAARILASAQTEQDLRMADLERRQTQLAASVLALEDRRKKLREWAQASLETLLREADGDGITSANGLLFDLSL